MRFTIALVLALSACGPKEVPTSTPAPAASAQAEVPAPSSGLGFDIAQTCAELCSANGAACDLIDVAGCTARCAEELVPLGDVCPTKVDAFVTCVQGAAWGCKEGDKLRVEGCDDSAYAMAGCAFRHAKGPGKECATECEFEGQCDFIEGECVGPSEPEHCHQSVACTQDGRCTLADGACVGPTSRDDCVRTDACRSMGECSFQDGACVGPLTDEDCALTEECADLPAGQRCVHDDGFCEVVE